MAAPALGAERHLGIHSSGDTDDHFRTVTPRKKKLKRKREGSLAISLDTEDLQAYSGTSTDSESDGTGTDTTIFGTPSGSYTIVPVAIPTTHLRITPTT